ncbi:O-antigen ligase family protein [Flavobacterium succinicans]|uniref:O-antigen ligase n=1 Tax=Flavobacterium succinicans TaxID=29536 RepID=A0A199XUR6_9FLAO|nr:O-antigen ligase family protein [Flavobacterium succinicans]OAZ05390.1 O-antigen ligase [Flavobacterium succinicans]
MKKEEKVYLFLLAFHAFLGMALFAIPLLSKVYGIAILVFGIYYIVQSQNRNNEALLMAAYAISAEIILRMTGGAFVNEYGKYLVMLFLFLGMLYAGFSRSALVYWLFLFFLVPSVVLSTITLDITTDVKKAIVFNISGPVCLGIAAIYCFKRQISFQRLVGVVTAFSLPLLCLIAYLYVYSPSVQDVVTGTQSNFETSGGFGPNQVSTILGFGIFIFFVQLLLNSSNALLQLINGGLVVVFAFRGLVTFSRGGVYTGVVMILLLVVILYFQANFQTKPKIAGIILLSFLGMLAVWSYSSIQTNGLLNKRYANQDASGREKKSILTGREYLMETELKMFFENPVLGVGVGKNKELRQSLTGIEAASHNEITRMLAEHGALGVVCLLILLLTPLYLFAVDQQNLLALSFYIFWLLTINHAAMRLAAPAFVYALSLLKVHREAPAVHRK